MKLVKSMRDLLLSRWQSFSWRQKFLLYLYGSWLYTPIRDTLLAKTTAAATTRARLRVQDDRFRWSGRDQRPQIRPTDIGVPPKMHLIGRAYHILTNVTLLFMFIKLTILYVDYNETLPVSYFLRCYTPRFVLVSNLEEEFMPMFTYVLCINHLLWRLVVYKLAHKFDLDMVPFLLARTDLIEERISLKGERFGQPKVILDILDRSMFFKMDEAYILRPNRNLSSRNELIDTINLYFDSAVIIVTLVGVSTISFGAYTLAFRQNSVFAKCGLDRAMLDPVYLYRYFASGTVSLVFFFDAMMAILLASVSGYLFSVDLLLYWRHIRTRIDKCHLKTAAALLKKPPQPHREPPNGFAANNDCFDDGAGEIFSQESCLPPKFILTGQRRIRQRSSCSNSRRVDKELRQLKWLLIDFFARLRHVDEFITILIPMAMAVWQSCNFVISFCGLQLSSNANEELLAIRSYQSLGIFIVIGLCTLILRLKRNTEPAYPVLCSIVARDRSLDKRAWLRLLSIYTQKPRYAFTFMHGSTLSQLTFLKIISYTLTITVIIRTMRIDHANVHQAP